MKGFSDYMIEQPKNDQIKQVEYSVYKTTKKFSRQFKHVKFNGFKLSIQASYNHHCTPQLTINIKDYERMEFAIIDKAGFGDPYIYLDKFTRLDELKKFFDGSVFSYVPIDLIEDMFNYLYIVYGIEVNI